jgi:hypothetical protein
MFGTNDHAPGGRHLGIMGHAPALLLSAAALALSLGGAAYATSGGAQAVRPAVTSVTFHKLTLLNGWVSEQAVWGSGNPSVGILNGVVYLSGSLAQSPAGLPQFATLPAAYRPAHSMWITTYTFGGTSGTLAISKTGVMVATSAGTCGTETTAECYTSLAGISFPKNS